MVERLTALSDRGWFGDQAVLENGWTELTLHFEDEVRGKVALFEDGTGTQELQLVVEAGTPFSPFGWVFDEMLFRFAGPVAQ